MKHTLLPAFLLIPISFAFAGQTAAKPAQPSRHAPPTKKTSSAPATPSPRTQRPTGAASAELQSRYDRLLAARNTGDPEAVAAASRSLLGLALRQAANLRMIANHSEEAVDLYRKSLTWEEVPDTHLDLAIAEIRNNQIDEALAEVEGVLAVAPDNARAWHVKGNAQVLKKDFPAAIASLSRSLALHKDVNVEFALGSAYLLGNNKPEAQKVFQSMLTSYGDRAIWHVVFGGAYREAGMMLDAAAEFKKAIALQPDIDNAHFFLGLTLLEQNMWARTDESMAEFREAVRQHPKDYAANFYLGVGESQLQQFEPSNLHLRAATAARPDDAVAWVYLGLNAYQQQKNTEARDELLKAFALAKGTDLSIDLQKKASIILGRIYHAEGNRAEADRWIAKAKAFQLKALDQSKESISEMTGGMAGAPTMPRINVHEQVATPAQQAPVDATAPLSPSAFASTALSPTEQQQADSLDQNLRVIIGTAYNDLGTADARRGLYLQALERFHEAERWDPKTPGLMRNIGLAALKTDDQAEAARALKAAVEIDPNDQLSRARLAMTLFKSGQFAQAAEQFKSLGNEAYSTTGMAYAWAYSLVRTAQPKPAAEVLARLSAMRLDPDLLVAIGDLYAQLEDYDRAIASYRKALELAPEMAGPHFKIGASLIRMEKSEAAIPELKTELQKDPSNIEAAYNLAYADIETSRKDEGMALLRHLLETNPDHANAQYLLGKTLVADQKFEEAIPHLEAAVRLNPESSFAHYQLQLAYRRAGRTADADREAAIYRDLKNRKREQVVIPMPEPPR